MSSCCCEQPRCHSPWASADVSQPHVMTQGAQEKRQENPQRDRKGEYLTNRGRTAKRQPPMPAQVTPGQQCLQRPTVIFCLVSVTKHSGGYVVRRPCSREVSPLIFPPWLEQLPANPELLSHLHIFLFHIHVIIITKKHCFHVFKNAILSLVGFYLLLIRRKGHKNVALQATKEGCS